MNTIITLSLGFDKNTKMTRFIFEGYDEKNEKYKETEYRIKYSKEDIDMIIAGLKEIQRELLLE
jgi:hypothetical protein